MMNMKTDNNKGSYFTEFMKHYNSKVHFFDYESFDIWEYLKVEMFGIGKLLMFYIVGVGV